MKKFEFSMQRLLDAREALRAAREMEFFQAQVKLQEEEEKRKRIQEILERVIYSSPALQTVGISYFQCRELYLARLREFRRLQEFRINEARTRVESLRRQLKDAMTEVKTLEKVRERERADWELDYRREEQKINDEIATGRVHFRDPAESLL